MSTVGWRGYRRPLEGSCGRGDSDSAASPEEVGGGTLKASAPPSITPEIFASPPRVCIGGASRHNHEQPNTVIFFAGVQRVHCVRDATRGNQDNVYRSANRPPGVYISCSIQMPRGRTLLSAVRSARSGIMRTAYPCQGKKIITPFHASLCQAEKTRWRGYFSCEERSV